MLHAFIDESGQRGHSELASPHFLMSAAVVRDRNLPALGATLEELRAATRRSAGHHLSWKNIRSHHDRLHIAKTLGIQGWLKTVTVVSCKEHLDAKDMTEDHIYLYHFRLVLERISWLAKSHNEVATYTLAHIKRFKLETLREYEARLRAIPTQIKWSHLDPKGGSINQPQRLEELQVADLVTSANACAFNPDPHGNTESRYLKEMRSRMFQPRPSSALTSYGLKIHPWTEATKAAYPWIAAL